MINFKYRNRTIHSATFHIIAFIILTVLLTAVPDFKASAVNPPENGSQKRTEPLPRIGTNSRQEFVIMDGIHPCRWFGRGVNIIRYEPWPPGFNEGWHNAIFSTYYWDLKYRDEMKDILDDLSSRGYNLVRVFIDYGAWAYEERDDSIAGNWYEPGGDKVTPNLNVEYLENFVEFVMMATERRIYVMPVIPLHPFNENYFSMIGPTPPEYQPIQGLNARYLDPRYQNVKSVYTQEFATGLLYHLSDTYITSIFAISLENELAIELYTYDEYNNPIPVPPFRGFIPEPVIATGAGLYDMTDYDQRQACIDDNFNLFSTSACNAIRTVDSKIMVTTGVYGFDAVGFRNGYNGAGEPDDPLFLPGTGYPPRTCVLMQFTPLDFIDFHYYDHCNHDNYTMAQRLYISNEWNTVMRLKPVLMGEMGVFRANRPDCLAWAAETAVSMQVESCNYKFKGWLWWTHDNFGQPELWHACDPPGANDMNTPEKAILQVLSPDYRPNPYVYDYPFWVCVP